MKKAIVIYHSKKGTTKQLGHEIANQLSSFNFQVQICSSQNVENKDLNGFDYVFLGCWTKDLMICAQHPDNEWKNAVKSLRFYETSKIVLFATYKIACGSMFSRMQQSLPDKALVSPFRIASKNGQISNTVVADFLEITSM